MMILIVNVGSTSLKFKLYDMPAEMIAAQGAIEGIGRPVSRFKLCAGGRPAQEGEEPLDGYLAAIRKLIAFLTSADGAGLDSLDDLGAVGFKTVLARDIMGPVELTEDVLRTMEECSILAPSHNPPYIAAIRTFREALPHTPLVGLFEPAFHQTMPEHAWRYAVPREWHERHGIRRYGYHGASHRFIAGRVPEFLGVASVRRIISCHLGGSSSICAILDGKSIDTSMGYTPQSGVLHSTRPHDLDPFIPLVLIKQAGMTPDQVIKALCSECGLLALSGVSGEMRDVVEAAAAGNERAELAITAFCYGVKKQIGAYVAALGGVDAVVFTGGIGERSADIRARICDGLECMGIVLDRGENESAQPDCAVESSDSRARILALATNEELVVARATAEVAARRA